jgi:hypothetical protein
LRQQENCTRKHTTDASQKKGLFESGSDSCVAFPVAVSDALNHPRGHFGLEPGDVFPPEVNLCRERITGDQIVEGGTG